MIIYVIAWSHCMHDPDDYCDNALPSSPEMIIIIDHNIYRLNDNGNRKKHQSLLLREISSALGPSSPPSRFLS